MALTSLMQKQQTATRGSADVSASLIVVFLLMLSGAFWGISAVLLFRALA